MKTKYRPQKGDLVEVGTKDKYYLFPNKGEVMGSRFALMSIYHMTLIPSIIQL